MDQNKIYISHQPEETPPKPANYLTNKGWRIWTGKKWSHEVFSMNPDVWYSEAARTQFHSIPASEAAMLRVDLLESINRAKYTNLEDLLPHLKHLWELRKYVAKDVPSPSSEISSHQLAEQVSYINSRIMHLLSLATL